MMKFAMASQSIDNSNPLQIHLHLKEYMIYWEVLEEKKNSRICSRNKIQNNLY